VFDIVFSTAFPSTKYVVIATGYKSSGTSLLFGRISTKTTAGCTIKFGKYSSVLTDADPSGKATLMFYGLTS